MSLAKKILIGLFAGVLAGIAVNVAGAGDSALWQERVLPLFEFLGALFIRLITMLVIPLVVGSLVLGITSLGDLKQLGRIGGRTLAFYLTTTAVAVTIGLTLATVIKPGSRIAPESRDALAAEFNADAATRVTQAAEAPGTLDVLLNMVPNNVAAAAADGALLPLIIFVLIFGAAISAAPDPGRSTVVSFFQGITDAAMRVIDWVMLLAPYAVFALVAAVISRFGMDVLRSLAIYVAVVVTGLMLHMFGTLGTFVAVLGRRNPLAFFRDVRPAQLIGFSTSSSNATLPVTLETAEERLKLPRPVASFVLPLGATMNMDGTALYQGVAAVFIAQVYGVDLGIGELATVVLTATLASVGAAGVPSAGIITLVLVLESVGLAAQAGAGIALILGVDRILDMIRTAVNVTGDLACATVVSRSMADSDLVRAAPPAVAAADAT